MIHIHKWQFFKTYTARYGYECCICHKKKFIKLKRKYSLHGKEILC